MPRAAPSRDHTPRVLVVDDEAPIRHGLAELLRDAGYDARVARNGREALAILAAWRADVVLLDLLLPELTGWDFVARYREWWGQRAAILVITAAGPGALRSAAQLAVEEVLSKPLDFDRVLELVAAYVRQRRSWRVRAPGPEQSEPQRR